MKKITDIWSIFEQKEIIGSGTFADVYKAKNIKTGDYVAIKEIKKSRISFSETNILKEIEIMKKLESQNSISLIDTYQSPDSYYIIMELCLFSLDNYLKLRENPLSIDEIRKILIDLNKCFKEMNEKKIFHSDLKPSNILLSVNKKRIDEICFKLSDFGLSKLIDGSKIGNLSISGTPNTMAPEVLKGNNKLISLKSDIWSLGIIIYKLLFNEYPYIGNEYNILKQIESKKKLNIIHDKDLNNLVSQMLEINVNKRISWEKYFEHPFFTDNVSSNKLDLLNFPSFINECKNHSKNIIGYCSICKKNVCESCLKEHSTNSHKIYIFNYIGFSKNELKQIDELTKEIDIYLNKINQTKEKINAFIERFRTIQENSNVFGNDNQNNFKLYTIKCLSIIKERLKIEGNVILPVLRIENSKVENKNFVWELRLIIFEYLEYISFLYFSV